MSEVIRLARELMEILDTAVHDAYKQNKNLDNEDISKIQKSHAYRYARYINGLGWDFLTLEKNNRFSGSPIILRTILESIFCLGAIAHNSEYAAERALHELDDIKRKLDKEDWGLTGETTAELEELRNKIYKEFPIEEPKGRKVIELAEMASLRELYEVYRMLCNSTHPTLRGTISNEIYGSQGWRFSNFGLFIALTLKLLIESVSTSNLQSYLDKTAPILEAMNTLHENGAIEKLNKKEQEGKDSRIREYE
jgi:hypothetical protein